MSYSLKSLLVVVLCLGTPLLHADTIERSKGQRTYFKECKRCHGNGVKGAAMQRQGGWDERFADGAALLVEDHDDIADARTYFQSSRFRSSAPYLHAFLRYYAEDSGNVPVCSD
jgi:mono/diheme cytochrome c family protein